MYFLKSLKSFDKKYHLLKKKNKSIEPKILKAFKLLRNDPFYPSLKTHKVQSRRYGKRYSSWVTGDLRIIWDFDEDSRLILILLDLGGHTGSGSVY